MTRSRPRLPVTPVTPVGKNPQQESGKAPPKPQPGGLPGGRMGLGRGSRETILVVDRSETLVNQVVEYLARAGFDTAIARDGQTGLDMAIANPPSLLLLDVVIPGLNGVQLLRSLGQQESLRDIPVVIMSAKADEMEERLVRTLGVAAVLQKPFPENELIATVEQTLNLYRGWRQTTAATPSPIDEAEKGQRPPPPPAPFGLPEHTRLFCDLGTTPLIEVFRLVLGADTPSLGRTALGKMAILEVHSAEANLEVWIGQDLTEEGPKRKQVVWLEGEGIPADLSIGNILVSEGLISNQDLAMHVQATVAGSPGNGPSDGDEDPTEKPQREKRDGQQNRTGRARRPGLPEQLLALGYFDGQGLIRALERQTSERLLAALAWPAGYAVYRAPIDLPAKAEWNWVETALGRPIARGPLAIDLQALCMQGLERMAHAPRVNSALSQTGLQTVFHRKRRGDISSDAPLTRKEMAIYDFVNGRNTLADMVRAAKLPALEIVKILFRLEAMDLVYPARPPVLSR